MRPRTTTIRQRSKGRGTWDRRNEKRARNGVLARLGGALDVRMERGGVSSGGSVPSHQCPVPDPQSLLRSADAAAADGEEGEAGHAESGAGGEGDE